MTDVDELAKLLITGNKIFHYDNFAGTEHLGETLVSTGAVTRNLQSVLLETGVYSPSSARVYYTTPIFNPKLSSLFFKARFSSGSDVLAYAGFTESLANPVHDSVETHAGLLIYNGGVYFSSGHTHGTAAKFRNVRISGIDPTRWLVYKISGHEFSWFPLPVVVPYFDDFIVSKPGNVWSNVTRNSDAQPLNQAHYFQAFIQNETNENKTFELEKLLHVERQPD